MTEKITFPKFRFYDKTCSEVRVAAKSLRCLPLEKKNVYNSKYLKSLIQNI
jgi:hypothetical protein